MKLNPEDAQLFYELFFPLLDYVNENFHVTTEKVRFAGERIDPQDAYEVANFLWKRVWIIDDYLNEMKLSDEHREIILGWKRCIPGTGESPKLCKPPKWSRIGAPLWRYYKWEERIAAQKSRNAEQRSGSCSS